MIIDLDETLDGDVGPVLGPSATGAGITRPSRLEGAVETLCGASGRMRARPPLPARLASREPVRPIRATGQTRSIGLVLGPPDRCDRRMAARRDWRRRKAAGESFAGQLSVRSKLDVYDLATRRHGERKAPNLTHTHRAGISGGRESPFGWSTHAASMIFWIATWTLGASRGVLAVVSSAVGAWGAAVSTVAAHDGF